MHLKCNFDLCHGAVFIQEEHILKLMTGMLDRLTKLVGACETSSSIGSHITY